MFGFHFVMVNKSWSSVLQTCPANLILWLLSVAVILDLLNKIFSSLFDRSMKYNEWIFDKNKTWFYIILYFIYTTFINNYHFTWASILNSTRCQNIYCAFGYLFACHSVVPRPVWRPFSVRILPNPPWNVWLVSFSGSLKKYTKLIKMHF